MQIDVAILFLNRVSTNFESRFLYNRNSIFLFLALFLFLVLVLVLLILLICCCVHIRTILQADICVYSGVYKWHMYAFVCTSVNP